LHTSHTFNFISKQDGSWGHTPSTENTLCKISNLALRRSTKKILYTAHAELVNSILCARLNFQEVDIHGTHYRKLLLVHVNTELFLIA